MAKPKSHQPNPSNHVPSLGFQVQAKLHSSPPVFSPPKFSAGGEHPEGRHPEGSTRSMDTHGSAPRSRLLQLVFIKQRTRFRAPVRNIRGLQHVNNNSIITFPSLYHKINTSSELGSLDLCPFKRIQ